MNNMHNPKWFMRMAALRSPRSRFVQKLHKTQNFGCKTLQNTAKSVSRQASSKLWSALQNVIRSPSKIRMPANGVSFPLLSRMGPIHEKERPRSARNLR